MLAFVAYVEKGFRALNHTTNLVEHNKNLYFHPQILLNEAIITSLKSHFCFFGSTSGCIHQLDSPSMTLKRSSYRHKESSVNLAHRLLPSLPLEMLENKRKLFLIWVGRATHSTKTQKNLSFGNKYRNNLISPSRDDIKSSKASPPGIKVRRDSNN